MKKENPSSLQHKINAHLWYWKTVVMFAKLKFFLKIIPPDKDTLKQLIADLEELKSKLMEEKA